MVTTGAAGGVAARANDESEVVDLAARVRGRVVAFYDGDCGLCDRLVVFMLRRDRSRRLLFAPLQGESAAALLPKEAAEIERLSTILVLAPDGRVLRRSRAVAFLLRQLRRGWPVVGVLLSMIPVTLADGAYDWVARRRQRFFPTRQCPVLPPEQRLRFLP